MTDAPYKSFTYKGLVISWNGGAYQAVNSKTGAVMYTGNSPENIKQQIDKAGKIK